MCLKNKTTTSEHVQIFDGWINDLFPEFSPSEQLPMIHENSDPTSLSNLTISLIFSEQEQDWTIDKLNRVSILTEQNDGGSIWNQPESIFEFKE